MKTTGNEYMMILRDTDWDAGLPTGQVAETIERYNAWVDRLLAEGVLTGGRPLLAGGRVVTLAKNGGISDGPFAETKEVIGGYIVIKAETLEDATAIAATFPPIARGVKVELRELADECPVSQRQLLRLEQERAMA